MQTPKFRHLESYRHAREVVQALGTFWGSMSTGSDGTHRNGARVSLPMGRNEGGSDV
jgi:hypothetical protein